MPRPAKRRPAAALPPPMPPGGRVCTLADVAQDIFLGVNPERLPKDPGLPDGPLIAVKDVVDGRLAARDGMVLVKVPVEGRKAHHRLVLGDVVVTVRGTLLKVAVVGAEHVGGVVSTNLAVLRPNGLLDPHLIAAALRSDELRAKLLQEATQSTIQGIYLDSLRQAPILVPPAAEQAALARLYTLAEREHALAVELAEERHRAALRLVSGILNAGAAA